MGLDMSTSLWGLRMKEDGQIATNNRALAGPRISVLLLQHVSSSGCIWYEVKIQVN